MLIRGPVPTPYTIVQHSFRLTFRKRRMVSSLLLFISRAWDVLILLVYSTWLHLPFSYRRKILSIVVPSYFENRNIAFAIKFKPFPALNDNNIQQFQVSKPYKNPYEQVAFSTATTIAKRNPQKTDNIVQKQMITQTYSWEKIARARKLNIPWCFV